MDATAHPRPTRPPVRRRGAQRGDAPRGNEPRAADALPVRAQEAELVLLAADDDAGLDPELAEALGVARELARRAIAETTEATYRSHLARWDAWCERRGYRPLPPEPLHVIAHLVEITCRYEDGKLLRDDDGRPLPGEVRAVTASARLAALNRVCKANDLARPGDDARVKALIAAIRRAFGTAAVNAKLAIDKALLRELIRANALPTDAQLRDRALLAAVDRLTRRPGSLARLDWAEVRFLHAAVEVGVPEPSRTTQRRTVTLRATGRVDCPVRALLEWHERCGRPNGGAVFHLSRQGITKALGALEGAASDTAGAVRSLMQPTRHQVRNQALLLTAWMAALRRSNAVGFDWCDLEDKGNDVEATLRRSKNDQEGQGFVNWLPRLDGDEELCPVRALRQWKRVVAAATGVLPVGAVPVFCPIDRHGNLEREPSGRLKRLSGDAVAGIVKALAQRAGLDPDVVAAHSLRAGWITEAAQQGQTILQVQSVTHQKSADVVAGYFRPVEARKNNPVRELFEKTAEERPGPAPPPPVSFADRMRRRM